MKISRIAWILVARITLSLGIVHAQEMPHGTSSATIYKVPLGSEGNSIELTIECALGRPSAGVKVVAGNLPSWIHMGSMEESLPPAVKNDVVVARFMFSVDKLAPVNREHIIQFTVSDPQGGVWIKEIVIAAVIPDRFELRQNYPNPFNPQTKIEYSLAEGKSVKLVVYDLLGQEVKTLVDEFQDAGVKSVTFNAGNLPSGMYFYRLHVGNYTETKKLMLLK